jgi:N6-adenosine-specific RNA methylase IME4
MESQLAIPKDGTLARLKSAHRKLAAAQTFEDVLAIRDEAEAIRQLLKVRKASRQNQNAAASLKIRAERKMGEALAVAVSAGNPKLLHGERIGLKELGINATQSHRWQAMAKVPEEKLVELERLADEGDKELTSREVYKLSRADESKKPIIHHVPIEGVTDDLEQLIAEGKRYRTIYADPPWQYDNKATRSNVESEYAGTMSVDEICELPVRALLEDDAHLHLWTTTSFLPFAFGVIEAWGFEYRSELIWIKPQMGIGNYWRVSHEILLLGIRGNAKSFNEHEHPSWLSHDRLEHSQKPQKFRQLVERVSNGPYLELFGRRQIPGWTVFGNQVEPDDTRLWA